MDVPRFRPLQLFKPPLSLRSGLLHNSHEHQVPLPDDLAALHEELLVLKSQTELRIKIAEGDLAVFDAMYRRAKEREKSLKGKLKGKDRDKEHRDKSKDDREHDRESKERDREPGAEPEKPRDRDKASSFKIKREYSGTPDAEETTGSSRINLAPRKPPNASAAKAAAIKAAAIPHPIAQNAKRDLKSKNKRKRLEASDDDADSIGSDLLAPPPQRVRPSPHSHSSHTSSSISGASKPLKHQPSQTKPLSTSTSSAVITSALISNHMATGHISSLGRPAVSGASPGFAVDFTLPPKPALPPKPVGIASAGFSFTKTPTDPRQVVEDFTERKAPPNQIPTHNFWKEVETWMKPVGEEDVAWLEFDADDAEPFLMPVLGRHYTDIWDEEDAAAAIAAAAAAQTWPRGYSLDRSYSVEPVGTTNSSVILQNPYIGSIVDKSDTAPGEPKPKVKDMSNGPIGVGGTTWDPRAMAEPDLVREEKSLGPLTERIVSAFLLRGAVLKEEDALVAAAATVNKSPPSRHVDVSNLEYKIRNELQTIGLLSEEEPDFSNPLDDDVASTLRRCQTLLRQQRSINSSRKSVLLGIARDRLAYQDYVYTLEGIERGIISGFQKMLKVTRMPKKKKDKDKSGSHLNGGDHTGDMPTSSRLILEPSETLMEKVKLRERWLGIFGNAMDEWDKREAGRLKGLPEMSIYQHLTDTLEDRQEEVLQ